MPTPVAEGLYPRYSKQNGAIRYGVEDPGPPIRFQGGRFVELDPDSQVENVEYAPDDGIYVRYSRQIGAVTYGP